MVGKKSTAIVSAEKHTVADMYNGKESEEGEMTIVDVRINKDVKEWEMERSSEREDGGVGNCSVKDGVVLDPMSDEVEIAMVMSIA